MNKTRTLEKILRERRVVEAEYWSLGGHFCSAFSYNVTNQENIRKN
ncbi:MAG: hypothetical protein ACW96U_13385 [Candidatus Heimdallarchaeaceae archaeon]|jgi:hypothetical protein